MLGCALLAASGLACGDDALDAVDAQDGLRDAPPPACLWETDELLSQVEVSPAEPPDCGQTRVEDTSAVDCFTSALSAGQPAQLTINDCIDCLILSTYVNVPTDGVFHLYREADLYGDALREVRVESCGDGVAAEEGRLSCSEPSILYRCVDPLPDPSAF